MTETASLWGKKVESLVQEDSKTLEKAAPVVVVVAAVVAVGVWLWKEKPWNKKKSS